MQRLMRKTQLRWAAQLHALAQTADGVLALTDSASADRWRHIDSEPNDQV